MTNGKVNTLEPSMMKKATLSSTGIDTYFAFPASNASAKSTICEFTKCLMDCLHSPHQTALTKEAISLHSK